MQVKCSEDEDGEDLIETFPHHTNLGALQQSALDGCHLCSILVAPDPTVPEVPPSDNSKSYASMVICAQNYDGPGRIEMKVHGTPPEDDLPFSWRTERAKSRVR